MGWLGIVLATLLVGLIAGLLARAIVPGRDAMSLLATILLGVVGSLVGMGLAYLLKLDTSAVLDWILAVAGAVIALLVYNRIAKRNATP